MVTRLWAGWPEFNSWQGQEFFLSTTSCRPAPGPTQPSNKLVPGALTTALKADGMRNW